MSQTNLSLLFEPWLDFKRPIVQQLAFCIASPNIINTIPETLTIQHRFELHQDTFWIAQFSNYKDRLYQLDQDPTDLLSFMAKLKSTRLGLRFEYLLWFWLIDTQTHGYTLLGHSIQKIDGARTLGELDFVLFNHKTQQTEHWEVALKYYLGEQDLALNHWFGLNRDDTLIKKLNHFTTQQFKFESVDLNSSYDFKNLDHPSFQNSIHKKAHPMGTVQIEAAQIENDHTKNDHIKNSHIKIDKNVAVLKGQLYLPEQNNFLDQYNLIQKSPPSWINLNRRLGSWGDEIKQSYVRLSRHEWLCEQHQLEKKPAYWWCNGLYFDPSSNPSHYMFREKQLILLRRNALN